MDRSRFGMVAASLIAGATLVSMASQARGDAGCAVGPAIGGGFGNAGFCDGYSMSYGRGGFVGGCGSVLNYRPACGPRWNWGWNAGCRPVCPPRPICPPRCLPAPVFGGWCHTPSWNPCGWGGWYGGTAWGFNDSVFLSVPAGGRMTFFSGSLVPYPVYGYGYGYGFGSPLGWRPWLGRTATPAVAPQPATRPVITAVPRGDGRRMPIRASTATARLRAARLVARGDDQLRAAGQNPARLEAVLATYRQAVSAAHDQPDAVIRQALVLEALDRRDLADAALAQAVALDGRLRDDARIVDLAAVGKAVADDPVFDARQPAALPPLAARGAAILREIEARRAVGEPPGATVAWLADRWSARWGRGVNAVAANDR